MDSEAWIRTRKLVPADATVRRLFSMPHERLVAALAAASEDLRANGPAIAYRLALKEAQASDEESAPFLDSRSAATILLPVAVGIADKRFHLGEFEDHSCAGVDDWFWEASDHLVPFQVS